MLRIVVLGGGFAGMYTARHLEQTFRNDPAVDITLVSRNNYMVFTPLLPEVAGNSIGERHAVTPLRAFFSKTHVHVAEVKRIDLGAQRVALCYADGREADLPYDYLVVALGAVTNYHHVEDAVALSYDLKSLEDAVRLRNHVLSMLELADVSTDPEERREMLTFVAAGGGYAGIEGLGQLIDFVEKALRYYPTLRREELRFILASRGDRLLEQIDEKLGKYVVDVLKDRGVDVRLGVTVTRVTERITELKPGGVIPTRTVLWAAGIAVNPLVVGLDLPKTKYGALKVEPTLQVVGHPNIFALGDCAAVPKTGEETYAPTAQNAIRQAHFAAHNLVAAIRGGRQRPFQYTPIGSLASLGHFQAVAQIAGVPLRGFLAWFAWRTVYLFKLPELSRKIRVAVDWALDILLPTNIVQMPVGTSDDLSSYVPPAARDEPKPVAQEAA